MSKKIPTFKSVAEAYAHMFSLKYEHTVNGWQIYRIPTALVNGCDETTIINQFKSIGCSVLSFYCENQVKFVKVRF